MTKRWPTRRGGSLSTYLRPHNGHFSLVPLAIYKLLFATTGIRVRDLLTMAGARPGATVTVESLQQRRSYRTSEIDHVQARDPDTLLATKVNGAVLHVDHGYPLRLIGPGRPGVVLFWIVAVLAFVSAITVIQRVVHVARVARGAPPPSLVPKRETLPGMAAGRRKAH